MLKSREWVWQALNHREPDRVPFDLGGTGLSTIHVTAYKNLRHHLGLPEIEPEVAFLPEQVVRVDEDLAQRLAWDVRPVHLPYSDPAAPQALVLVHQGAGTGQGLFA